MKHPANPRFWRCYRQLPKPIQRLADESYELLRLDPQHPSLHFKKMGRYWSVRVGLHYRLWPCGTNPMWFGSGLALMQNTIDSPARGRAESSEWRRRAVMGTASMQKQLRRRLEKGGWAVGDAGDFLGLSDGEIRSILESKSF